MQRFIARTCTLVFVAITPVAAQQTIPIRQLGPADALSKDTVAFLYGVRELSNGRLIANDAGSRRLMLFDRSLATSTIIADSVSGSASPYGKRFTGIIPYLGDTTLLVDVASRAFVAFDGAGRVTGVMSPPRANDVGSMGTPALGAPRLDPKGRLIYRSSLPVAFRPPEAGKPFIMPDIPDSAPIIRADFDTRIADTLGWVRVSKIKGSATPIEGGGVRMRPMIDPLPVIDDWAMMSDGSIAVLRGRDYHIDWINADGTTASSPKMPFDWKRLNDDDKARIVDSTKKALEKMFANASLSGGGALVGGDHGAPPSMAASGHSLTILRIDGTDGGPAPKSTPGAGPTMSAPEVVPPSELPDYVPSVLRSGAMIADLDGNLWVLPSTSAQSAGGLLYDVINRRGELFERVRLPAGHALAGFGAGGAVYTTVRDAGGQHIERSFIK